MTNPESNSGFVIFIHFYNLLPVLYKILLFGFPFYFIIILNKDSYYENYNQPNQIMPFLFTTR